jgi:uncharacterized protein (TIGR01244 family)
MYRRLDDKVLVAGQIKPEDVAELASSGITMIVNNRPDGEEPGQPDSESIAAAARAANVKYQHIPVAGGLSPSQVGATAKAIDEATGKVLLFCRSGTRSTYLWAFARASQGEPAETLAAQAAAAGYDLSPLLSHLRR